MMRSKTPKDEEFSEENMIDKTIVDPEGTIIGTCVGIFEDEKKRQRMKVAIKTEIESDFIVEETIPINLINRIGEVILLKKKFEITPIALEDIISIEIPGSKVEEMLEKPVDEIIPKKPKKKTSKTKIPPKQIEEQKEKKKSKAITFDVIYSDIKQTQDKEARKILINSLLQTIKKSSSQRKKVLAEIFENLVTSDVQKRYLIVEILEQIA